MLHNTAYWITWGVSSVMSIIYAGCALATFNSVSKVSVGQDLKSLKYGMLASCFLGFIMVTMFALTSACVALVRPTHNNFMHHMRSDIGQGVLIGSAIHMIFFMLLAGLALHAGDSWAEQRFGSGMTYQTFRAAYGFAYLLAIMFIAFFFVIFCHREHGLFHHGPMGPMGPMGTMGMMPGTGMVPMAAVPTAGVVPTAMPMGAMPMTTTVVPAGYPPVMPAGYPGMVL